MHATQQCNARDIFCVLGVGKNMNSKAGYGVRADINVAEMEKAQPLGEHKLAVDAVSLCISSF